MAGRPSGNSTSTTGPTTWTTLPLFMFTPGLLRGAEVNSAPLSSGGLPPPEPLDPTSVHQRAPSVGLPARDLQQLLGDVSLPELVVLERQLLDEVLGAVGRVLHRDHARALLAGLGVQQHPVDVDAQIVAEEVAENALRIRLERALGGVAALDLLR